MDIRSSDPEFVRIWSRVKAAEAPTDPASAPDVPPLGDASAGEGPFLTAAIRGELARWRSCQRLCQWGDAAAAPLGRGALSRAKQLSAAWLLISGERYLPLGDTAPLPFRRREEGWRALFRGAQRAGFDYRAQAEKTGDPLLKTRYLALAQASESDAEAVLRRLEQG